MTNNSQTKRRNKKYNPAKTIKSNSNMGIELLKYSIDGHDYTVTREKDNYVFKVASENFVSGVSVPNFFINGIYKRLNEEITIDLENTLKMYAHGITLVEKLYCLCDFKKLVPETEWNYTEIGFIAVDCFFICYNLFKKEELLETLKTYEDCLNHDFFELRKIMIENCYSEDRNLNYKQLFKYFYEHDLLKDDVKELAPEIIKDIENKAA